MRITSKGQVTIPILIRERMGLFPGTEVGFEIRDGEVVVRKLRRPSGLGRRLVDHMTGRADTDLTTDEIMALTRGD